MFPFKTQLKLFFVVVCFSAGRCQNKKHTGKFLTHVVADFRM